MKKKILFSLFASVLFVFSSFSQSFEGVIEFQKIVKDTTWYYYHVKGNKIRVEEKSSKGTVKNLMIVDTEKNTAFAVDSDRKLYMDARNDNKPIPVSPEIQKTGNKKKMLDYEVSEWVLTNKPESTIITYWVAEGFDFFVPFLKTLNRKDKQAKYFMAVENPGPVFTFEGIETSLTGEMRSHLIVSKIEKKKVPDSSFEIPTGFVKFEK